MMLVLFYIMAGGFVYHLFLGDDWRKTIAEIYLLGLLLYVCFWPIILCFVFLQMFLERNFYDRD